MSKEYIEREAAIKRFSHGAQAEYYGFEAKGMLRELPAADVVSRDCYDRLLAENDRLRKDRPVVVRCGECKWFAEGKWCRNPNNDMVHGLTTGEWFCADGERKGGTSDGEIDSKRH